MIPMRLATIAAFAALAVSALATPPVPRKTPEFVVVEPSGKLTLLSSYKGKVVVLALMQTTCPHCQREAQMLTKLQTELGPRGLQVLGSAFNDATAQMVASFVKQFGVGFPVGYSSRETVESYLGLSVMDRYVVPQVAVIDRKGMIRAQSDALGTPNLQDEGFMRNLIDSLLKEGATTSDSKKAPATVAKTDAKKSN
jgi:peroxiredoxin